MEKENEDVKKGEDKNTPPVAEVMFQQERDPDEAVIAEQAIHHFVGERLAEWYEQVEGAIDSLEAWISTQDDAARSVLAGRGFFDHIGDKYIAELYGLAGGKGAPIMDALAHETEETVSWAQNTEADLGQFINYMRRGIRDATWFVRDNIQSVASAQWPQLLDLAYEGSMDFVPALLQMGLPSIDFKPQDFSDKLVAHANAYRRSIEPLKEEVAQQTPKDEEKKAAAEEEAQKLAMDDSVKKSQQQAVSAATM